MPSGVPKIRICPLCGKTIYRNLYGHFHSVHKDSNLTEEELVAKLLGLNEIPKCANPNCNNKVGLNVKEYKFREYCSSSCRAYTSIINYIKNNPEAHYEQCKDLLANWTRTHPDEVAEIRKRIVIKYYDRIKESATKRILDWCEKNPEKRREIASENARKARLKLGKAKRSNIEIDIFNRIQRLFPNLSVVHGVQIAGYEPDIVINNLLCIEIDGFNWHDIDKDLIRDKRLAESGLKVRRLDSNYCISLSDYELIWLVLIELSQELPYWERIPYEQIGIWKWNVYQTGPFRLLTYEH